MFRGVRQTHGGPESGESEKCYKTENVVHLGMSLSLLEEFTVRFWNICMFLHLI